MAMTHQEISDRFEALGKEWSVGWGIEQKRIRKEQASLRELCGGIGHIWRPSLMSFHPGRVCAVCNAAEPAKAA